MPLKKRWLIPVAAVVVLALVLVGWRAMSRRSTGAFAQYATATVQRGPLEVTVSDTGTLVSGAQEDLRPSVAATIDEVLAKVGDHVKKGQVLARLSNPDLITALDQARANLEAEQARLADMVNPQSKATENDIANARFRVAQAEATLAQRQADLDALTVKAPVNGVVSSISVYAGDQVAAQSALVSVVDLSTLSFSASVSQYSANAVIVGDGATVFVNGNSYNGKVVAVGPVGSGTSPTFPVTIAFDPVPSGTGLRPGMTGSFTLSNGPSGSGTVTARTYTLRSRTTATVDKVAVNVGDQVTAGQTLMTLTSDTVLPALQQAQNDLDNARVALQNLLTPPVTATQTEIAAERAKVAQMQANYEGAQRDVAELTVVAPFDGIVTTCNATPGARVAANASQPLFVVADFSKMSVQINVDELDVAKLKVGMPATVDVQAVPGQHYQATVTSISPQGTVSQGVATYPVTLEIADPKDLLAGMTANVTIVCNRRDDVLYVPVEAVQTVRNRSVVRILGSDKKVQGVEVTTGLANDMYIEIVSGLAEGQTVITGTVSSGNSGMFPGIGGFRQPNLGNGRVRNAQQGSGGGR